MTTSDQDTWHDLGPADLCEPDTGTEVVVQGEIIALFRVGQDYRAIQGTCPHHGGPLGKGTLQGCIVTCPWHGWQFDVNDGTYQHSTQLQHPCYPVKVEEGRVWIQMTSSE
jgi:nitrite reductase (NADH) small subunit